MSVIVSVCNGVVAKASTVRIVRGSCRSESKASADKGCRHGREGKETRIVLFYEGF